MKKLVLTGLALATGGSLAFSQGTIILQQLTTALVYTNTGTVSGQITQPGGAYLFEVLDMTSAAWAGLSGNQQTGADNLAANPSDLALWTDSGVSGSTPNLGAGAKSGISGGNGVAANNWAAPTGPTYTSGGTDYYIIVGWSSGLGANWVTVSNLVATSSLTAGGYFGETAVAFNEAGGGPNSLGAPTLFGASPSGATGLAGSSGLGTGPDALTLNQITVVPEPATLALGALGGISMLFLRRRKA